MARPVLLEVMVRRLLLQPALLYTPHDQDMVRFCLLAVTVPDTPALELLLESP